MLGSPAFSPAKIGGPESRQVSERFGFCPLLLFCPCQMSHAGRVSISLVFCVAAIGLGASWVEQCCCDDLVIGSPQQPIRALNGVSVRSFVRSFVRQKAPRQTTRVRGNAPLPEALSSKFPDFLPVSPVRDHNVLHAFHAGRYRAPPKVRAGIVDRPVGALDGRRHGSPTRRQGPFHRRPCARQRLRRLDPAGGGDGREGQTGGEAF